VLSVGVIAGLWRSEAFVGFLILGVAFIAFQIFVNASLGLDQYRASR
jgi:hypothetical protein